MQTLKSGKKIPSIGFGTWNLKENVHDIIHKVVEVGYRQIDCAAVYENEHLVGEALATVLDDYSRFKIKRSDVFNSFPAIT